MVDRGTEAPMAEDPANDDAATAAPDRADIEKSPRPVAPIPRPEGRTQQSRRSAKLGVFGRWPPTRPTIGLCIALLAPCVVLGFSIWSIVRDTARRGATATAASSVAPSVSPPAGTTAPSSAPPVENAEASSPAFYEETDDGEPSPAKRVPAKHYATVEQAAIASCSTVSVDGLSRQIIEQTRCLRPNAVVTLPTRPNVVLASNVFPYLEQEARSHLLRALEMHSSVKMTINSALRTVAQQYLVSRWGAARRCGVQLAALPGESNHEIGAALDIAEPAQWKSALEAQDFHWLGASDRVHFEYKGATAPLQGATDVLAFQTLWNRNHPSDPIAADGLYSPATEQRLKKAPPDGFPIGPTCGKGRPEKTPRG
jgi:hypothetical protein